MDRNKRKRRNNSIIFIKFLKQYGWYNPYVKNLKERGRELKKFLSNTNSYGFVQSAFPWHRTEEGDYFWGFVNDKWEEYLYEKMVCVEEY